LLHEWLALHELGDLLVKVHIALLLLNQTMTKPIHTFSGEIHFDGTHSLKPISTKPIGTHMCKYGCFREKRKRKGREDEERFVQILVF
jgi:hypothetical protein